MIAFMIDVERATIRLHFFKESGRPPIKSVLLFYCSNHFSSQKKIFTILREKHVGMLFSFEKEVLNVTVNSVLSAFFIGPDDGRASSGQYLFVEAMSA